MRLLLTSGGITNETLAQALREMVNGEIRIAFIPTAANVEGEPKDWLIRNFVECERLGPVDIVDISAIERELWLPRIEAASVIVVGGGDTVHLIEWMRRSGFANELPRLLETRVYVGISAGSIATNPKLATKSDVLYYGVERPLADGLGLVDFYVVPHLNSPDFPKAREPLIRNLATKVPGPLYAIDDACAIRVVDAAARAIGEGTWFHVG